MSSSTFLDVALPALVAYLLGGVPFGYLFVRFTLGKDVRTMGSGNIGATNVQRTAGTKAGVVVLLLDVLKGFAAVWFAAWFAPGNALALACALVAVVIGHCYPVFLKFKGGKAVACFIGAALFIAPVPLLITAVVFVAVVVARPFVSLGSIVGALVFPIVFWLLEHPAPAILAASVVSALLIVYRHRGNIERLRTGTENVLSFRRRSASR